MTLRQCIFLRHAEPRPWVLTALLLVLTAAVMPAQTNLALKKPSSQSSTYEERYSASACVDGNKDSFCHTNSEANPWWQVDLQGAYALSEIVVYNRTDCCGERSRPLTALISADGSNWTRIFAHDGSDFKVLRIAAGGRSARYVRLQLASTDYMNIAEVEVFGVSGTLPPTPPPQGNLALRKPASQSSTYEERYPASACVDGNKDSFCNTNSEANPWWQVDLQGAYALSEIVVYNRTDCCGERSRPLTALISADGSNWTRIFAHDGSDFKVLRINAGGRPARYVRLQLASTDYMNIAEVEVFGVSGTLPPTPPPPPPPGQSPDLGASLVVVHPNVCVAIWTRTRPRVYDAVTICQGPANTSFREVLTVESFDGSSVVIVRPSYGRYRGTVSQDRKIIRGSCDWSGCTPGYMWNAYADWDWKTSPPSK